MTAPRRAAADPVIVTSALLRDWPLPEQSGDKNASGRVLVVGGHAGMPGAVLLAAEAALRAGAGKVQIATVQPVAPALGVAIPEAFVVGLPATTQGELAAEAAPAIIELAGECDAVLLGPGLMRPEAAADLLARIVPELSGPVCLDALALAYLTGNLDGLGKSAGQAVLTPNTTELATTLGGTLPERLDDEAGIAALTAAVRELAAGTGATVVSGAEVTVIGDPDGGLWRDDTGGQGLAVSGSGDVKAGILAGLRARGLDPVPAAVWAEHVHGRCGERLAADLGRRGFLARDLLPVIPQVMAELQG